MLYTNVNNILSMENPISSDIKSDEIPSIKTQGVLADSSKTNEYITSNTPSVVFMDRRQPFFTQSSTIGNESQLGRNWFLRKEKAWTWKDISEMFEKFGLLHQALVRKANKKFSKGFDVVIPSEKNITDSTHDKAKEIHDIMRQYSILSKMAMGDIGKKTTGGFLFFLRFNDAKTADDLKNAVNTKAKNFSLEDIDVYSRREIADNGIIRDTGNGKIISFKMRMNWEDTQKDKEVIVDASRIIEYFYNPDGYHVNGLTELDCAMGVTDELRNLIWNVTEVVYRHAAPFTKIHYPCNLNKDGKELLDSIGTHIAHYDLVKLPTGQNGEKIWDIVHDSDFANIPDVKPLLDFITKIVCASWGMSESEVFGYEGTTSSSQTAVLERLADIVAELNLIATPFLYRLFKRLEDFGIIKDKTSYDIQWRPLYEQTKQQEALINFYNGQTGNLLYAQQIGYKFNEYGAVDFGTLKYPEVPPPQKAPPEKPEQLPKSYTDLPNTKATLPQNQPATNSDEEKELIDNFIKGDS